MYIEGFSGKLERQKRQREILPALLGNALLAEDELHIAMQLQFNERLPIVISFYEYYRFLDRFVTQVLDQKIADKLLVRVKMPSTIALPKSLLDPRVAIFHDLDAESQVLAELGHDHLCVDANFKLYSWSAGNNSFTVSHVSPSGRALSQTALDTLQSLLATLPARYSYFNNPTTSDRNTHVKAS